MIYQSRLKSNYFYIYISEEREIELKNDGGLFNVFNVHRIPKNANDTLLVPEAIEG